VELYLHSPNTPSWRDAYLSTGTKVLLEISKNIVLEVKAEKTNCMFKNRMQDKIIT